MELPDNQNDIRLMVAGEMEYLVSSDGFRAAAVDEITSRSQGNFLWASLITKQVVSCHRKDQVQRVLDSTPDGTNQLYDRMMDAVTNLKLDEDKALAEVLLTWSMYAKAPVTVEELSEVCPAELGSIMDLYHTVNHVCGQFVVVNPQGRITLVHPSAREYLERTRRGSLILDSEVGNGKILPRCLAALCDNGLKRKLQASETHTVLPYASTSWSLHLEDSPTDSDGVLDAVVRFSAGACLGPVPGYE